MLAIGSRLCHTQKQPSPYQRKVHTVTAGQQMLQPISLCRGCRLKFTVRRFFALRAPWQGALRTLWRRRPQGALARRPQGACEPKLLKASSGRLSPEGAPKAKSARTVLKSTHQRNFFKFLIVSRLVVGHQTVAC